jgi:hypothetical protein
MNHSLLLLSIWHCQHNTRQVADLSSIISLADYLNHSIFSYEEIDSGTKFLVFYGLIQVTDNQFKTTEVFTNWFEKQKFNSKIPNYSKQWTAIGLFLKQFDENKVGNTNSFIHKDLYDKEKRKYLN